MFPTGGNPNPVYVSGQDGGVKMIQDGFTRPANTTAYADGDGVTNSTSAPVALRFFQINRSGKGMVPLGFKMTKSATSITNASFRLWLYSLDPTAVPNDNAAFSPAVWADRTILLGYVDFTTWIAGSDGAVSWGSPVLTYLAALPAQFTVFGIIQAKAAYTPASGEGFAVQVHVLQD